MVLKSDNVLGNILAAEKRQRTMIFVNAQGARANPLLTRSRGCVPAYVALRGLRLPERGEGKLAVFSCCSRGLSVKGRG